MEKPMFLVALDTRGLPAADLQEGFEELACSPKFFIDHIVRNPKTKRVNCPLAEICGLTKQTLLGVFSRIFSWSWVLLFG
jgi:hypothetical protein